MRWIATGSGCLFHSRTLVAKPVWRENLAAGLDAPVVGRHDLLERLELDGLGVMPEMVGEVDEHAASLHAVEGHVLEPEVVRETRVPGAVAAGVGARSDEVDPGAVAVVVDGVD